MKKLIFLISLLLFSCKNQTEEAQANIVVKKKIMVNAEDAILGDCSKMINIKSLIPLKMKKGDFLGTINKVLFTEDKIIIFDKRTESVSFFDNHGNFLSKIAKKGHGPDEYLSIANISITAPNILNVIDKTARVILHYDFNGELLGKKNIEGWPNAYAKMNTYEYHSVYSTYLSNEPKEKYYLNIKSENNVRTGYFPFTGTIVSEQENPTYFFSDGKDLYYHLYFDDSIYRLEGDKIVIAYKIDFGENTYPTKELLKAETPEKFREILEKGKYIGNIFNIHLTKDYLHFMYSTNEGGVNTYIENIKTNEHNHYSALKICDTGSTISVVASDGEYFYSVINSWELSEKSIANLNATYNLGLTKNSEYSLLMKYNYN